MRRTSLFLLINLIFLAVSASQLTPAEALARLNRDNSFNRTLSTNTPVFDKPILTVKSVSDPDFTGVYVFDKGEGYVIVSADDCAVPLLGFSDTNRLNPDSVPPQLQYWLDFYTAQILHASKNGVKEITASPKGTSRPERAQVSPLVKTKWSQDSPYNNLCPMDGYYRSVTGCVATAMAQIMKFHEHPKKGTGSHSYTWNRQTLSLDFSNITFDWANMLNEYTNSATSTQKNAVANLMYACGVSVDMGYSSSASGAYSVDVTPALYNYFGYDMSMVNYMRFFFSDAQWEEIVYNEVAAGRPVLYGGQSLEGGHEFVCDGYRSDGYFHINWGWAGMSDGYFLLSALDPYSQGIGGSASGYAFNEDQEISVNIKPAQSNSAVTPLMVSYGDLYLAGFNSAMSVVAKTSFNTGDYLCFQCDNGIFNFACTNLKPALFGVRVVSDDGNTVYWDMGTTYDIEPTYGLTYYYVRIPSNLANGSYYLYPSVKVGNLAWENILIPYEYFKNYKFVVTNGVAIPYEETKDCLSVTNFKVNSPIYVGKDYSCDITFKNKKLKGSFSKYVMVLLDNDKNPLVTSSTESSVDLASGETKTVTYKTSIPEKDDNGNKIEPGEYYYALYSVLLDEYIYVSTNKVTVAYEKTDPDPDPTDPTEPTEPTEPPVDPNLLIIEADVQLNEEASKISSNILTFEVDVKCTKGTYTDNLYLFVYPAIDRPDNNVGYSMAPMNIKAGRSEQYVFNIMINPDGYDEFYALACIINEDNEFEPISEKYYFGIKKLGVTSAEITGGISFNLFEGFVEVIAYSSLDAVSIYNTNGVLIKNVHAIRSHKATVSLEGLIPGVYVIYATDCEGNKAVDKLVITSPY